ncbi:MAG: single-stranded DNA-binding protein [Cyclobacteriaceae bacterium]
MQETNLFILSGRLTADCEVAEDNSKAKFTVANHRSYKKKDADELTKETHFFNFILWRPNNVTSLLKKGTPVTIEARISNNNYENDGVKHYTFNFEVNNITIQGSSTTGSDQS